MVASEWLPSCFIFLENKSAPKPIMLQAVKITPEPQKATGDKTVLTGSLF